MPKYKKSDSRKTNLKRLILTTLKDKKPNKLLRSEVRDEHSISEDKGETHNVFNELKEKHLTKETPKPMGKTGKVPFEVEITEKGEGYLQAMIDFGIGL